MLHLTFAHKRKTSGLQRLVLNWWPNRSPSQWAPRCQGLCNFSAWNFWLAQAGLSCKDSLVLHVHMLSVRMGFGSLGDGFETTCWNYLDLLLASNAIGCIWLYNAVYNIGTRACSTTVFFFRCTISLFPIVGVLNQTLTDEELKFRTLERWNGWLEETLTIEKAVFSPHHLRLSSQILWGGC